MSTKNNVSILRNLFAFLIPIRTDIKKQNDGNVSRNWSTAGDSFFESFSWFIERGIANELTTASVVDIATMNLDDYGYRFYSDNEGKAGRMLFNKDEFKEKQKTLINRLSTIPAFNIKDIESGKLDKTFVIQLDYLVQNIKSNMHN